MILTNNTLYICDNGRVLHGKCCGTTAQTTGADLSGAKVYPLTGAELEEWQKDFLSDGLTLACESCGRT